MSDGRTEKLDIIFRLEAASDSQMVKMNGIEFERSFKSGGISDFEALQTLVDVMQQLGMVMEFNDGEKRVSVQSRLKQVEKQGKWGRSFEANGLSFRFGNVTALKHSFIVIKELTAGAAISWDEWIKPFLRKIGFVQAWVSDVEYDHWQNAKDLLDYTAVGRDYSQMPMKSNGLPPPLEQKIIDTTNNPGRWSLQSGYVEAIGAAMWIGEPFWECTRLDRKARVKASDWLNVETVNDNVLHLQASESSFSDLRTAEVQNKLRAILYGT